MFLFHGFVSALISAGQPSLVQATAGRKQYSEGENMLITHYSVTSKV